MRKKVLLTILDGWGIGDGSQSDVISVANTPYWDKLIATYPNSKLLTCGENVGLPDGQMGNSEVGHLNIGAGRVVYQDLVKIPAWDLHFPRIFLITRELISGRQGPSDLVQDLR